MSTATRPRLLTTLVLAAATVLGLLGTTTTASAAPAAPQLSIHVDDGQTEAHSGTTLRYAVTVSNLGGRPVRDLALSQTVPSSARLGTGDGGRTEKGLVRWKVDVPAGKSVTVQTSMEVGKDLPADLLRLATVVCAGPSPKAAPTVCASDSDQLPAGAAAVQQQRQLEGAARPARPAWMLPSGIALGGLLVVGALVAAVVLRRRRGQAPGRRGLVPQGPA
ncbi:MAG: hypothetical protein ACRYG2_19845 [Janthinobacterium lividum]